MSVCAQCSGSLKHTIRLRNRFRSRFRDAAWPIRHRRDDRWSHRKREIHVNASRSFCTCPASGYPALGNVPRCGNGLDCPCDSGLASFFSVFDRLRLLLWLAVHNRICYRGDRCIYDRGLEWVLPPLSWRGSLWCHWLHAIDICQDQH